MTHLNAQSRPFVGNMFDGSVALHVVNLHTFAVDGKILLQYLLFQKYWKDDATEQI